MSYEVFKHKVKALIERTGEDIKVRFSKDTEKGKHFANFSDGTMIIGNKTCLKVLVRWGSGHQAIIAI